MGPMQVESGLTMASHGRRLLAFLVDRGLMLAAMGAMVVVNLDAEDGASDGFLRACLISFVVALVIIQLALLRHGKSIGKFLFRLRIVNLAGETPSFGRLLFVRLLVGERLLGMFPIYGIVDSLWVLQNHRRAIHDFIADTYVVYDQDRRPAAF